MSIINAAGMDVPYGTYVDDACFDIHDYDADTDHDAVDDIDDDTNDDTDDDTDDGADDNTDDGGRGYLYTIKIPGQGPAGARPRASQGPDQGPSMDVDFVRPRISCLQGLWT